MLSDITIDLWRIALVFASLALVYFVADRRGHRHPFKFVLLSFILTPLFAIVVALVKNPTENPNELLTMKEQCEAIRKRK
jgi:ABC-type Fe3+-siderophore transport system permease subunit